MNDPASQNRDKLEHYFAFVYERFLSRIKQGKVGDSCFAALLMMFAVIDSLGRLTHEKRESQMKERFELILCQMGQGYTPERIRKLRRLRNALVHEAANRTTLVSAHSGRRKDHLTGGDGEPFLVHTAVLAEDLRAAVVRIHQSLLASEALLTEAASRRRRSDPTCPHDKTVTPPGYTEFD